MKKLLWFILLLIIYGCQNTTQKVAKNNQEIPLNKISHTQSEKIYNKSKLFPNKTQLSIAIIENGQSSFYGVLIENDKVLSVENRDNVFEIGSITKIFTSTLLSGLVIENKVELDDYINKYLKFQLKENQKITFKQLANHTSGLPGIPPNSDIELKENLRNPNPYKNYDEQKLIEYLSQTMELGDRKMSYSNLGAALLGYTLSKIENKSYELLLQERVFSKYDMINSTTDRCQIKNKLIKGLDENGNVTPNSDLAIHVGAGGILSTTEDLAKFAIAQFDSVNKELALTRQKTFTIDENQDIGLGWGIIKNKSKGNWYSHFGATGGYSSAMTIDPTNRNGVIILSNVSYWNKNQSDIILLSTELLQTLLQK